MIHLASVENGRLQALGCRSIPQTGIEVRCEPVSRRFRTDGVNPMARGYDSNIFFARATTFAAVKPYCFIRTSAGADAPNFVIPSTKPSSPTYADQPMGTPASTASLFLTPEGKTLSRYSGD